MDYIPNTDEDRKEMLKKIGIPNHLSLFNDIQGRLFLKKPLDVKGFVSELELRNHVTELSKKNKIIAANFLGAGAYYHYIPSTVDHTIRRNEFYTAYTPYQPEVSQGMLQAIYEFQTVVANLTGMDVANASMYDGSTALAEAMLMCVAAKSEEKAAQKQADNNNTDGITSFTPEVIVSAAIHPEYREVLRTYTNAKGITLKEIDFISSENDPSNPEAKNHSGTTNIELLKKAFTQDTVGVIIQSPNFFGCIEDVKQIAELTHQNNALLAVSVVEITSLGLLKSPGSLGADIVAGEGQGFGIPVSFGGPYLGILACKEAFIRRIPGRIVGLTTDNRGQRGFVLTLQAREQHIRREKATSNICTNQALCMLAALVNIVTLGKTGVQQLGELNLNKANYAYQKLKELDNFSGVFNSPVYNEFVIKCRGNASDVLAELLKNNIIGGLELGRFYPNKTELENSLLICVTEMMPKSEIDRLVKVMEEM
ncbi:aminomethyl-transferring glycine dehydrogenase subunit GcvPA [Candidatus Woesearchaeota archaeon]|nr:aminomethyl-transferring glycine dehydrogenase subunit GcvPA [Candidatus Woesearchaeota archaeon]